MFLLFYLSDERTFGSSVIINGWRITKKTIGVGKNTKKERLRNTRI